MDTRQVTSPQGAPVSEKASLKGPLECKKTRIGLPFKQPESGSEASYTLLHKAERVLGSTAQHLTQYS